MEKWIIKTMDGVVLAQRYSYEAAERAADEFRPRWPQGVVVVKA